MLAQRIGDILVGAEGIEQRGALEHEAHAPPDRQQGFLRSAPTSTPSTWSRPRSGRNRPAHRRSMTVLPEPLPPMTVPSRGTRRSPR